MHKTQIFSTSSMACFLKTSGLTFGFERFLHVKKKNFKLVFTIRNWNLCRIRRSISCRSSSSASFGLAVVPVDPSWRREGLLAVDYFCSPWGEGAVVYFLFLWVEGVLENSFLCWTATLVDEIPLRAASPCSRPGSPAWRGHWRSGRGSYRDLNIRLSFLYGLID